MPVFIVVYTVDWPCEHENALRATRNGKQRFKIRTCVTHRFIFLKSRLCVRACSEGC